MQVSIRRSALLAAAMLLALQSVASAGVELRAGQQRAAIDARIGVGARLHQLAWSSVPGRGLLGTARGRGYDVRAKLIALGDGAVELRASIRYRWTMKVWREMVTVQTRGGAMAITRTLRFESVNRRARVDRGTPALTMVGDVVVVPEAGVAATEVRRRGSEHQVRMIIYDYGSHPRRVCTRCAPITVPNPWRKVLRITRRRGDVINVRARLYMRKAQTPVRPLVVERWASGAKAAIAFTDHADRTDPMALRAVLYGTSDPTSPRYGKGGFFGHGLRLTKTFFVRAPVGGLHKDKAAATLADELVARGSEVGLHSIHPWRETRSTVRRGLRHARRWKPVTWIDHQPQSNCEAISNRGATGSRTWGIAGLLARAGMRWIWASNEATFRPMELNVFRPAKVEHAAPAFFPLHGHPTLWVFSSNWFYGTPRLLDAAMSAMRIAGLERDRGLFVGHSYLSTSRRTTSQPRYHAAQVTRQRDQALELHPQIEAVLARLGARVKAGAISTLTWAQVGQRLLDLGSVYVAYRSDGRVSVRNGGARDVRGLTVSVFDPALTLRVDGKSVAGRKGDGRSTIWFDLPAGKIVVIAATKRARVSPMISIAPSVPVLAP